MSRDRWLVHIEHGEYSNWCYDPIGIFDTEEEAREFASRIRIRLTKRGWLVEEWRSKHPDDVLVPFERRDDGTYSLVGDEDDECELFITCFKGGIGVLPSFAEVVA